MTYVIAGAGPAGVIAAETLRKTNPDSEIILIGDEPEPPYSRMAIPYLLARRDMLIQARTGSGKPGAFLLPMLKRLDQSRPHCQALVLVPTRELARQAWHEAETLCGDAGLRHVPVYGGVGYGPQVDALRDGAHIVVGTPGRVLDHLLKRTMSFKHLKMVIFDEADRMLSMGFYPVSYTHLRAHETLR